MPCQPLPRSFYNRDTVAVARDLLGKRLVRLLDGQRLAGLIVESEAYCGRADPGSHAYRGPTPRAAVMFGESGHAYVYFIYGMHHCFNVVAHLPARAGAVLVRGLQPLEGLEEMQARRRGLPLGQVSNGPARLCQALGIARQLNGLDLCLGQELWVEDGDPIADEAVLVGPRVGLNLQGPAAGQPWRFAVAGNRWVSRPLPPLPLAEVGLSPCQDGVERGNNA